MNHEERRDYYYTGMYESGVLLKLGDIIVRCTVNKVKPSCLCTLSSYLVYYLYSRCRLCNFTFPLC